MDPHLSQDLLFYSAFLGGQFLFILKRCASAIRSKTNPVSTRLDFIKANWDLLLIRALLELPIFWAYRHYSAANGVLSMFTSWKIPDWLPQAPLALFMLGYMADSALDWIGASPKAPEWLKENIPGLQVFSSHTVSSGKDATGADVTIEKSVTVEKTPSQEQK